MPEVDDGLCSIDVERLARALTLHRLSVRNKQGPDAFLDHSCMGDCAATIAAEYAALAHTESRPTHGRHCPCSACARQDWTDPILAPCGEHGPSCPRVYTGLAHTESATDDARARHKAEGHTDYFGSCGEPRCLAFRDTESATDGSVGDD